MDDRLAERLRLFREGGHVRPEVTDFVTAELNALRDEGRTVTEATAGMLTSHLVMALTRLLDGEPAERARDGDAGGIPATDEQLAAELCAHPEAVARARAVAARADRELGAALPDSEVAFLGLHLAVLGRRLTS
ncbi:transcriptional antiterminator [Streptomyces sp. NPDC020141]|uniref:transcriptional antiterminator n=1 Tax=Streptomyces sp. NPDC020141 TaxID=3365065 RepID=UPI0037B66B85